MWVDHSFKDEDKESQRCPGCGHVSTVKAGEKTTAYGLYAGISGEYFYCQNPKCNVERIYNSETVMVSGTSAVCK